MPFINIKDPSKKITTPKLPTGRSRVTVGNVTVAGYASSDSQGITTAITLDKEVAAVAGLKAGTRVSILRGTGVDEGKIRIVADVNGPVVLTKRSKASNSLWVRSRGLLQSERSASEARVTSVTKDVLTLAA